MNNLRRIFPALDRRKTDRKVKIDRKLSFEMLERRLAFTADLLDMAMNHGELHHVDYYEGANQELHVSNEVIGPYIQQADPANPEKTLNTITPTTLADTFKLHSNPGATKRIYLDFDGHVTTGTYWNSDYAGGQAIVSSAFDLDGNASAFSDDERTRIQLIWERVSEDFIPFDIDVTTEDPGTASLSKSGGSDTEWGIRMVIGGGNWWTYGGGGVTFVGSFNWSTDTPAFVFPSKLSNGSEKYTAECISHEAGHALGLSHDGRSSPGESYYAGHGSGETGWAPIMGNGYYQNVTQWSKGEYLNANQSQDDLSIITSQNGFTYRTDDRGDTNSTAALLNVSGALISDWGIIERTTDVDAFTFSTGAGTIQINANPLDRGPNLDIFLELYDMANNLVASSNPTDSLSANISVGVTAQQYVLRVSGTGKGNPLTDGYSRYASLGQYFLSGTIISGTSDTLSVVASDATKAEGNSGSTPYTFIVTRTGDTSSSTTVNYAITGSGSNPSTANDFVGGILPSGIVTFAAGETSKTITVLIAGDTTVESDEGFTLTLSNASGAVIATSSASGLIQNDDAALSVVAADATKAEGNTGSTPYTFVVTRSGDTSGSTTVDYAIVGSGSNPSIASDFSGGVLPNGTVTFAAGETSKTITVLISGDTTVENDEGFTLSLSNGSGSTVITTISASGLIQNDDGSLSLVAGEAINTEGNNGTTPYTFVVTRSGDLSGSTTVDYAIAGSGSNPIDASDFAGGILPSGSINFATDETSKSITVLIAGDTTVENDEGFTLTLSNATGSTVITTISASGLIQNDDVALSVVAADATKAEGNTGSTPYTFVVSRTGDTSVSTTVNYAVVGSGSNPITASDFVGGTLPSGTITFAAGETSKTITVLIAGDVSVENDEGFTLSLSNASGSTVITTISASGLIQNDDAALAIGAADATKAEGNTGSTPYSFVVSRTGDTSGSTTVNYAITGGGSNPTNASDFAGGILPSGTINFAAGETSKTITVLISGDTSVESDEGFTVTLSNPSGSTVITTSSATGLIQNDDVALSVVAGDASKSEGNTGSTPYTFVVSRTGDISGTTTVNYAITGSGSNPTNASDFAGGILPSGTITFAAGEASKTITVFVAGDSDFENTEDFAVTFSNASGAAVISGRSANGLVQNDDIKFASLSIVAASAIKAEGNSGSTPYTFLVNRTGNTIGSTTVNYTVIGSGSNPSAARDFAGGVLPKGVITFAAGETSKTITILISGDTTLENDEGFTVTLSNASGTSVITGGTASGLIQNDEAANSPGTSGSGGGATELIRVSSTTGLVTKESRTRNSFTVVLISKPTADVTIQVKSLDTTEGMVDKNQLRFTPTRWNVPQTVFVTGVDDTIRDGDITYKIDLSSAISMDRTYNGRDVSDVWVTNQDNETGRILALASMAIGDFNAASGSIDTIMAQVAISNTRSSIGVSSSQTSQVATLKKQPNVSVRSLVLQSNSPSQAVAMSEMAGKKIIANSNLARVEMAALDRAFSDIEILLREFVL